MVNDKRIRFWTLLLLVVLMVGLIESTLHADFNFGHTNAVENKVQELDQKIRESESDSSNPGSDGFCTRSYPKWLQGVENTQDLRKKLLVPDTSASTQPLSVKNNTDFSNEITADTILQRCNTYFRDQGDTDIKHWVYCRAFQLPSGDTYSDLGQLEKSLSTAPSDLYTLAFFHGSNIDDPSENWLVPFLRQYREGCNSRTVNVIWMGVRVTDQSRSPPEDLETLGNKWHVTSTDWNNTVLYDVMKPSILNFTGHTTASCPLAGSGADTHGLWVGGTAEDVGRRFTNNFSDSQALWVGKDSINKSACYRGVTSGNPVNANGRGVQLEYQVTVSDTSDRWVDPSRIADYVLDEF